MHIQWTGSDYNPQRGCNNGEGGPPDCKGCTTLIEANQAANRNSRADRSNLVPMGTAGRNFPASSRGVGVDLYDATTLETAGTNYHPFDAAFGAGSQQKTATAKMNADQTLWNLMYIGQEEELQSKFSVSCLSQTELEAIKNQNQRENTPQNCAKLNGKAHPYFDAGVTTIKTKTGATTTKGKTYAFFSSRNNNFSNRDQTMNICVRNDPTDTTCGIQKDITTDQPIPTYNPFDESIIGPDGLIQQPDQISDEPTLIEVTTQAPIEKDNDSVGTGDAEACEARVEFFVRSVGFAGLIAIACAVFALGIMGTLVMQACWGRMVAKDVSRWKDQPEARI